MNHTDILMRVATVRNSNNLDMRDRTKLLLNLAFVHQIALASETILLEAAALTTGPLSEYYAAHAKEETDHENWLASDLLTYGIEVQKIPRFKKAIEMVGAQYYLLKHHSPYCLLGYMLTVEGFPLPLDGVDILEELHGTEIMRTVRYHSINDLEHREDLFAMIDANPMPEIMDSAVQTAIYINEFCQEINSGLYDGLIKEQS